MNKEVEEMDFEELYDFINTTNEKVIKNLTKDDNIFKQIDLSKIEIKEWITKND